VTIMPRFSPRTQLLALVLSACSGLAAAQQPVTAQPPPTGQSPTGLQRIEPGSDRTNSNIPVAPGREGTQIKETRGAGGVVTEAEVTTPGGSHYYMKPNGTPQWKVGTFDLSGKRHATSESGTNAPTTADAPPPPPMPATAGPGTK
jgi:hypothetical protein